jgi:hypothetical protein
VPYRLYIFWSFFLSIGLTTLYAQEPAQAPQQGQETKQASIPAQEKEFLDESPQDVYGLHTTTFITPFDLKFNKNGFSPIHLSSNKLDRFTYRQRAAYKLQDLGNEGTAAKYIFYQIPLYIGVHAGFHAYDIYFRDPLQHKYYDAKAPYSDGSVVFANYGSFTFDAVHARSFNKNWHLGGMYESMLTDREFIPNKIPYDRQVISYAFTLFGHYKSTNERYQALLSFYRKSHRNRETGGIHSKDASTDIKQWLRPKANTNNNLPIENGVKSKDLRQQYSLYQQFVFVEPAQFYHELLISNNFNHFTTKNLSDKSKKFLSGQDAATTNSLQDKNRMQTLSNEWGIKGQMQRVFYQYYYRNKYIDLHQAGATSNKKVLENYLGLYTRTNLWKNIGNLHLHGEYLQGDLYQVRAAYENKYVELAYDQIRYKPSFLSLQYASPYRKWHNYFRLPVDQQLKGTLHIPLPGLALKPYARFVRTMAPIYFKKLPTALNQGTAIAPYQAKGHADILTWGGEVNITLFSHYHLDTEIATTKVDGPAAHVFRMPKWYTNARVYYADSYHEGKATIETGIELNWKSAYKADGYDPVTQQFFVQDDFIVDAYPIVELFFNFRIKTFRGFLKLVHLNQGLPSEGYFVTPFYPGQLRSIDFGVGWSLFD